MLLARPGPILSGVFILYAIPLGLIAGLLIGGRIERLGAVRFRLGALAVLALAVQVVLFSPLGAGLDDAISRAIYVASTVAVGIVVLANIRLIGVPLIVLGAASNLVAIVANGGAMPADPGALAAVGAEVRDNTNSVLVEHPAVQPLTDIFATPAWLPFANVFSVGDLLIGLGIVVAIAAAMRPAPEPPVRPGHPTDTLGDTRIEASEPNGASAH